jgi:hypothetical protein
MSRGLLLLQALTAPGTTPATVRVATKKATLPEVGHHAAVELAYLKAPESEILTEPRSSTPAIRPLHGLL